MTHDSHGMLGDPAVRRVHVPLDGSAFAESALPYALDVARRTGASIELLAVRLPQVVPPAEPAAGGIDVPSDTEERDALRRHLDPASEQAIDAAVAVAGTADARYTLLRVARAA